LQNLGRHWRCGKAKLRLWKRDEVDANSLVMPGLDPGIYDFLVLRRPRRGWPGQARPWRRM